MLNKRWILLHPFSSLGSKQSKNSKIKEYLDKIEGLFIFQEDFDKTNELLVTFDTNSLNNNLKKHALLKLLFTL